MGGGFESTKTKEKFIKIKIDHLRFLKDKEEIL